VDGQNMDELKSKFSNYADKHFLIWLIEKGLEYKEIKNNKPVYKESNTWLILIYCQKYCIKLYDGFGHGEYSFTANLAKKYDERIYEGDYVSIYYVFRYFKLENYSFSKRTELEYRKNIPLFLTDLKILIEKLNNLEDSFWDNIRIFAKDQAKIEGLI
jgi:hypothetical protein